MIGVVRVMVAIGLVITFTACGPRLNSQDQPRHASTHATSRTLSGSGLVARPVPSHSRRPFEYCGTKIADYAWPVVVPATRLSPGRTVRVAAHSQFVIEVTRDCARRVHVMSRGALRVTHAYPSAAGSVAVQVRTATGVGILHLIGDGHTQVIRFLAG